MLLGMQALLMSLISGAWFYSGSLVRQGLTTSRPALHNKPWRFLRLVGDRWLYLGQMLTMSATEPYCNRLGRLPRSRSRCASDRCAG